MRRVFLAPSLSVLIRPFCCVVVESNPYRRVSSAQPGGLQHRHFKEFRLVNSALLLYDTWLLCMTFI